MKCLNEFQLEQIISGKLGVKPMIWKKHLNNCPVCIAKLNEVKDNLNFSKSIKWEQRGRS